MCTIVLKIGLDRLVQPSVGHSFDVIRWIGPEDDWIGIGSGEPTVLSVNRTNRTVQLFFFISFLQSQNGVVLITPNLFPSFPRGFPSSSSCRRRSPLHKAPVVCAPQACRRWPLLPLNQCLPPTLPRLPSTTPLFSEPVFAPPPHHAHYQSFLPHIEHRPRLLLTSPPTANWSLPPQAKHQQSSSRPSLHHNPHRQSIAHACHRRAPPPPRRAPTVFPRPFLHWVVAPRSDFLKFLSISSPPVFFNLNFFFINVFWNLWFEINFEISNLKLGFDFQIILWFLNKILIFKWYINYIILFL